MARLVSALPASCHATDQPSAALVIDLKQRGLLDTTVVHWGGEMGRLPVLQNDTGRDKWGRDHNTYGFSQWVAGGGFKRGHVHGETDEWGHHAVKDIVHHYDWHATLLHCFGLDHTQLTYKRNGLAASLTDGQPGRVVADCWRERSLIPSSRLLPPLRALCVCIMGSGGSRSPSLASPAANSLPPAGDGGAQKPGRASGEATGPPTGVSGS